MGSWPPWLRQQRVLLFRRPRGIPDRIHRRGDADRRLLSVSRPGPLEVAAGAARPMGHHAAAHRAVETHPGPGAVRAGPAPPMKVIQIGRAGGPDVLDLVEVPTPSPAPGEVLVKADAIGVNYFDTMIRNGRYRWMPKLPFVLGNELSGHVAAIGPGVGTLKVGQRVFVAGYEIGNRGGLYAEYAAVPEQAAWPLPDSIGADEATTLTNYQLATILLHDAARGVLPRTVVVYGAAGGVGTALIDVARQAGAQVIGTAGSAEKCAFVRARGASHAVDYLK